MLLLFVVFGFIGNAQTTTVTPATASKPAEKEWDVSMYGFIRTDYIWDTRKSLQVRELNLNLYPSDVIKLADGTDQNDVGQSNFLSVVSRLGVKVKGPNVWGAKMTGTLEGDFFGNTEPVSNTVTNLDGSKTVINQSSSIGLFRLRHAYVNMDWENTSLVLGQTWNPNFIPEVFPGVANFNTGIMFNPFGWVTQIKLKQMLTKELSFSFTAYKDREFAATGPGTQNSASINSAIPNLNGQLQFKNKNWIAGLGLEYKSMQPLTEYTITTTPTVTIGHSSEKINTTSIMGYLKYSNDAFSVKAYAISGKNLNNLVMIGGYAGNTVAGKPETYEGLKTTAYWIDLASNAKKIAPGLFFGYTKNNGLDVAGATKFYARGVYLYTSAASPGRSIDNVWRLSGRVDFKQNKFRVSPELEYTGATWGDQKSTNDGTVDLNQEKVSNFRTMISCVYSF